MNNLTRTEKLILWITGINVITNIEVVAGITYVGKAQRWSANTDAAWKVQSISADWLTIRCTADGQVWADWLWSWPESLSYA